MNPSSDYTLFGHPVSRRLFYWSLFLCPGLALVIWLSSRSRGLPGNLGSENIAHGWHG